MALIIVEGVYENGKVELSETPEGVERAKVMVTFLTQSGTGRAKPIRKGGVLQARLETSLATQERYPQALRDEYEALIHKKLRRTLTEEEAARLETVRTEINLLDRQSEAWSAWEQRAAEVDQEIADLRQTLEALPDA